MYVVTYIAAEINVTKLLLFICDYIIIYSRISSAAYAVTSRKAKSAANIFQTNSCDFLRSNAKADQNDFNKYMTKANQKNSAN